MPKQRITKEMVVDTAFELARREGVEKVTVKALAESLGCSVQPIYSYCQSMDGLRAELPCAATASKIGNNHSHRSFKTGFFIINMLQGEYRFPSKNDFAFR